MRHFPLRCAALLALSTVHTGVAVAQRLCFRGEMRPGCQGFVLLEGTGAATILSTSRTVVFQRTNGTLQRFNVGNDLRNYASAGFGYLRVVDPRTAIGAVVELGNADHAVGDFSRIAVTARWRRQFLDGVLDLGGGPLRTAAQADDPFAKSYGATVETAFLYRQYVGFTVGADVTRTARHTAAGLHAGMRVGSYATLVSAVAAATVALIALASLPPMT